MRQSRRPIIKNKDHIACTPPLIHALNNNHLRCMCQMKKRKNDYVIDERKFENNYITFLLMDKKSSNLSIDG
jgi:hypothetical protein